MPSKNRPVLEVIFHGFHRDCTSQSPKERETKESDQCLNLFARDKGHHLTERSGILASPRCGLISISRSRFTFNEEVTTVFYPPGVHRPHVGAA
jgi:hypothetical protein